MSDRREQVARLANEILEGTGDVDGYSGVLLQAERGVRLATSVLALLAGEPGEPVAWAWHVESGGQRFCVLTEKLAHEWRGRRARVTPLYARTPDEPTNGPRVPPEGEEVSR